MSTEEKSPRLDLRLQGSLQTVLAVTMTTNGAIKLERVSES